MTPEEQKIVEAAKGMVASYRKWQGSMKRARLVQVETIDNDQVGSIAVESLNAREEFFMLVRELDKVVPNPCKETNHE